MAMFMLKDIQNEHDLSMLRKGRCPWCFERLTPVFQQDEHVSDQCVECDDVFATTMQAPSTPAEFLAEYVRRVGPDAAGRIILGG